MELKEAWTGNGTRRPAGSPQRRPFSCKENFLEYTRNSSMHGLKYIGEINLHPCERCFWAMAFIMAVAAASYFIWNLFNKFNNMPVIMSLSPSTVSLTRVPFPAITICNMNNFRKKNALDIQQRTVKGVPSIDRKLMNDLCGRPTSDEDKIFDNETDWDYIQKFMVNNTQPCHEMLVACIWSGNKTNCSKLFNPTLTDEGMCCTFNRLPRNFIFSNPRDLSDLNVTFEFPAVDWTPQGGYKMDASVDSLPWRPVGAGSHMGLTIVVDAEVDQYYCSSENSIGFKVLLHNPIETPKVASFGSSLPTGRETRVVINPKIMQSTSGLINIDIDKRQCYFENERKLKYYRTYTQRNCNLECESNYTLYYCKCVLYYMSKDNDTRICGGSDDDCASAAQLHMETSLRSPGNEEAKRGIGFCNCLPGCWEFSYTGEFSASPLSSDLYVKPEFLGLKDKNYFVKNMAVIHFFFTQKQFTATERGVLYGFTEFLSNTGGILGLFMGFSFLSVVEIAYYLSLRVFCSLRKKRKSIEITEEEHKKIWHPFDLPIPFTQ